MLGVQTLISPSIQLFNCSTFQQNILAKGFPPAAPGALVRGTMPLHGSPFAPGEPDGYAARLPRRPASPKGLPAVSFFFVGIMENVKRITVIVYPSVDLTIARFSTGQYDS